MRRETPATTEATPVGEQWEMRPRGSQRLEKGKRTADAWQVGDKAWRWHVFDRDLNEYVGGEVAPDEATAKAAALKLLNEPTIDKTEAGEQAVLPGAERIGQGEQAQRAAEAPLKPKEAQKPTDFGLFGDEAKQTDSWIASPRQSRPPSSSAPSRPTRPPILKSPLHRRTPALRCARKCRPRSTPGKPASPARA